MKKMIVSVAVLLLIAGVAAATEMSGVETLQGVVKSIDAAKQTITVDVKAEGNAAEMRTVSFQWNEKTKILKDNQPLDLSKVESGITVVVNFTTADGVNTAHAIGVQSKNTQS